MKVEYTRFVNVRTAETYEVDIPDDDPALVAAVEGVELSPLLDQYVLKHGDLRSTEWYDADDPQMDAEWEHGDQS